jgi:hypothetical protein
VLPHLTCFKKKGGDIFRLNSVKKTKEKPLLAKATSGFRRFSKFVFLTEILFIPIFEAKIFFSLRKTIDPF